MIVWLFAEERSGSTWLITTIATMLKLPFSYREQDGERTEGVVQTHTFDYLKEAHGVLLRTTRRDVPEHFLSWAILNRAKSAHKDWYQHPFMSRDGGRERDLQRLDVLRNDKFEVTRADVHEFLELKRTRNKLWDAKDAEKQTIYYEDLFTGVDIPQLSLKNFGFHLLGGFEKIPYDKREMIANWQEATNWINEGFP